MESLKTSSKVNKTLVLFLSIFNFLRITVFMSLETFGVILGDAADLGASDELKPRFYAFVVVIALLSFVIAMFLNKVNENTDANLKYLAVLFLADFIFFSTQNSLIMLAISAAMFALVLLIMNNPDSKIGAVLLPVFCLASCTVLSSSLFGFVLIAVLFYVVINIKTQSEKKTMVVSLLSLFLSGIGFSLHKILCNTFTSFASFIDEYNKTDFSLKKAEFSYYSDNMYMLLFTIPFVIVLIWFFSEYFEVYNKDKKATGSKVLVPILSLSAIVLNFASFYFLKREVLSIINLVPVLVIIAMIFNGDKYAIKALENINKVVCKHKLVIITILAVLFFAGMTIIYKENYYTESFFSNSIRYEL